MNPKIRQALQFLLIIWLMGLAVWLFNPSQVEPPQATTQPCSYDGSTYQNLQLPNLEQELEGTGLVGRIHGSVPSSQMFVLTVRNPEDFFDYRQFSLLASDNKTLNTLGKVKRHDRVCIQGHFLENPSPQKHILVKSVTVLESWSGSTEFLPYQREAEIPADLLNRTNFIGKVHAIAGEGQVLVVEYQDGVLPVFVESPEYTQGLFRGDLIRLWYRFQENPDRPTHLRLNRERENPLEVIDSIADWQGQEKVLAGQLVKFPQSPQLQFDVYGIAVETQGVKRYFTLVNFEDPQEFQNIRNKLAQIWDANLKTASSGRNMLFNSEVILEVRGHINVVSPAQANPQILLNKAEDFQVISNLSNWP